MSSEMHWEGSVLRGRRLARGWPCNERGAHRGVGGYVDGCIFFFLVPGIIVLANLLICLEKGRVPFCVGILHVE